MIRLIIVAASAACVIYVVALLVRVAYKKGFASGARMATARDFDVLRTVAAQQTDSLDDDELRELSDALGLEQMGDA